MRLRCHRRTDSRISGSAHPPLTVGGGSGTVAGAIRQRFRYLLGKSASPPNPLCPLGWGGDEHDNETGGSDGGSTLDGDRRDDAVRGRRCVRGRPRGGPSADQLALERNVPSVPERVLVTPQRNGEPKRYQRHPPAPSASALRLPAAGISSPQRNRCGLEPGEPLRERHHELPVPGPRWPGDVQPASRNECHQRVAERKRAMSASPGLWAGAGLTSAHERPSAPEAPAASASVRSDPATPGGPASGQPPQTRYSPTTGFGSGGFDWTASSS
jgi:hypothetical protein